MFLIVILALSIFLSGCVSDKETLETAPKVECPKLLLPEDFHVSDYDYYIKIEPILTTKRVTINPHCVEVTRFVTMEGGVVLFESRVLRRLFVDHGAVLQRTIAPPFYTSGFVDWARGRHWDRGHKNN